MMIRCHVLINFTIICVAIEVFIRVCFLKDDITRIFFISENASNNGICKDITGLGRWGNGDVELFMEHQDELDQIMEIVKQSFDAQAE
ncbi:Uncharacterized conserved protein [uncultured Ruminococcus sp.]|nr:Uncharacterized conserved protein [uncultured Ruminococcus sp.]